MFFVCISRSHGKFIWPNCLCHRSISDLTFGSFCKYSGSDLICFEDKHPPFSAPLCDDLAFFFDEAPEVRESDLHPLVKKKTCRPKLPEKKVRWHAGSWKPPTPHHKKAEMAISLPHANSLQTPITLSAPRALLALLSAEKLLLSLNHTALTLTICPRCRPSSPPHSGTG